MNIKPNPPRGALLRWRVIYHESRHQYYLEIVEIPYSPKSIDIVKGLQARRLSREQHMPRLKRVLKCILLFRKPIYGKASLSPVSTQLLKEDRADNEQISLDPSTLECYPCPVLVADCEYDAVLTQAFQQPELLGPSDTFLHRYSTFGVDNDPDNAGTDCLIMTYKLDKSRLAAAMFVIMVLCLSVGLAAGLLSKRVDMAFLFGGGAISFLTSAQVTIFWIFG